MECIAVSSQVKWKFPQYGINDYPNIDFAENSENFVYLLDQMDLHLVVLQKALHPLQQS